MRLPFGLRWWELVPEAVVAVGLTFFALTEPQAAASAFRSPTAIVLMVSAAVAWAAGRALLARFARPPAVGMAVFALAGSVVLGTVVLPAYDDETVVESLPVAAPTTTTTRPASPVATGQSPAPTSTTTETEPVAVRSGAIEGIDHRASGSVVVYEQPDGTLLVGLEDIDIQPGPDYDVYVVPGVGQESLGDSTRLDDLRGNKGTQYYPVPAGIDLSAGDWTVLVWCETFDVPVAGSTPI